MLCLCLAWALLTHPPLTRELAADLEVARFVCVVEDVERQAETPVHTLESARVGRMTFYARDFIDDGS